MCEGYLGVELMSVPREGPWEWGWARKHPHSAGTRVREMKCLECKIWGTYLLGLYSYL